MIDFCMFYPQEKICTSTQNCIVIFCRVFYKEAISSTKKSVFINNFPIKKKWILSNNLLKCYLKNSLGRNSDKLSFLQIKIYIYEESEKVKI